MMNTSQVVSSLAVLDWLEKMKQEEGEFAAILRASDGPSAEGFRHSIREICQQPATWSETARLMGEFRTVIAESLASSHRVVLTGSGSSQYAGECAAPALRSELARTVEVVGAGELLLRRSAALAGEPTLVVSLARSGESPESAAAVEALLETEPRTRHLIITCNCDGQLAREFVGDPRVRVIHLDPQVNDRSLVMTSSFTNLVLATRFLGWLDRADEFVTMVDRLGLAARKILTVWADRLASLVSGGVERVVFLSDERRRGATSEAALKILEMTAGKVATMSATYLGLRHGPMCFIDERTLVVCFLSSDPLIRQYELDLIGELDMKHLGARKLIAGVGDADVSLCNERDLAISYEASGDALDDGLALLDVMIAQILGFHCSREVGLQPDSPSVNGVINRVVSEFPIHRLVGTAK